MAQSVVSLNGIRKHYGKVTALEDITLEIQEGQILVLLGSNGSGKSTLLKIMAMLMVPDQGQIQLFGSRYSPTQSRRKIGFLSDHNPHWDRLSGYENAWFFARSYGISSDEAELRLQDLIRWAGIWDRKDDPVSTYSYGMRRKLALVQAISHRPELLLLDEPSMGLDYFSRTALYDLLSQERDNGTAIVIASNDIDEATRLASRVAFIMDGRMIYAGGASELMDSIETLTRIEVRLASPIPLDSIRAIRGIEDAEVDGPNADDETRLRLLVKGNRYKGSTMLPEIINCVLDGGGGILGIEVKEPDLKDLFLKLYPRSGRDET